MLQASSITVQSYGDVTLLTNSNAAITLTMAATGCPGQSSSVQDTTLVYANLNPAELDVDVGQAYGLQVQSQTPLAAIPEPLQVGQTFSMEVRVNSTSSPLIAYQVGQLSCAHLTDICACTVQAACSNKLLYLRKHVRTRYQSQCVTCCDVPTPRARLALLKIGTQGDELCTVQVRWSHVSNNTLCYHGVTHSTHFAAGAACQS